MALLSLGYSQAFGALVVDLDLGVLDIGEHEFEGDIGQSEGFDDNAQFYGTANQRYTSGEFVVSFTIEQELQASLQSVLFTFGDPDAFLLNGLETSGDPGNSRAEGWIANAFLDGALGSSQDFGVLDAGQYFISVEDWNGGPVTTAAYSLNFTEVGFVAPPEPGDSLANAISLGVLGDESTVISLDTIGSAVSDTELGVYSVGEDGSLSILESGGGFVLNDDIGGGSLQSAVEFTAPEGDYVAIAGEWDTGFTLTGAVGGPIGGDITLNHNGGSSTGTIGESGLVFFSFAVVPEPSSMSLIALAGLTLLRRRRS